MIGRLRGKLRECRPGEVLLDAGGVGYAVQIPLSTFYELCGGDPQGVADLYIHTHVREDTLALFGFATRRERELFELLLTIAGIGPKVSLAVLSGIGVEELERAVVGRDRDRLQRIPGIGRKTAERILLELQDRLDGGPGRSAGPAPEEDADLPGTRGLADDAISALCNLGYGREAARKAVHGAHEALAADQTAASLTLEGLLRAALQGLTR